MSAMRMPHDHLLGAMRAIELLVCRPYEAQLRRMKYCVGVRVVGRG